MNTDLDALATRLYVTIDRGQHPRARPPPPPDSTSPSTIYSSTTLTGHPNDPKSGLPRSSPMPS